MIKVLPIYQHYELGMFNLLFWYIETSIVVFAFCLMKRKVSSGLTQDAERKQTPPCFLFKMELFYVI